MPAYVAFLRAINLGASRKFPKDAIRAVVEAAGGSDVETYINTGNVRLTTSLRSRARVETVLEEAFAVDRGFPVPTIVFTPAELRQVAADAADLAAGTDGQGRHYVSLLKEAPSGAQVREAEAVDHPGERLVVRGRAVHLLMTGPEGYHLARLGNDFVEKRLGVATNRNLTVIRALADRWC